MERATLEVIAPSIEEALEQGLAQLGLSEDAVDVEVLDSGSKGFLGMGGRQVRIRLTVKDEGRTSAPKAPEKTNKADASPVATEDDRLLRFARQTMSELVSKMKLEAVVDARYVQEDGDDRQAIYIDINGDDLSILIGRRSETLNALQYIAGLIISKEAGHWIQVLVDVAGFRGRREAQLRMLARTMSEQAIRSGRKQSLEPMTAAERRIVHLELREHPEVETLSVGAEPYRKVTIVLKQ